MALDDVLVHIGQLGRYQLYMLIIASLGIVVCPVTLFSQYFFTIPTPHWCHVNEWADYDCSEYDLNEYECEEAKRNLSIPWTDEDGFSGCQMYNVTGMKFDPFLDVVSDAKISGCQDGWDFDITDTGRTLTAKYNLVCGRESLIHVSQSLYFLGSLIGCPIYGMISDRLGRLRAWTVCITQSLVFGVGIIFVNNFWLYTILRMAMAMSNYALWIIPFVYITEIVGHEKRMFAGLFVEFFWAGGYLMITAISWILNDWFYVHLAVIGFHILSYPLILLIPESPRWLLAKGKIEEADKILNVIARRNGRIMPPNYRDELTDEGKMRENELTTTVVPADLFRNRTILIRTLTFMEIWFAHGITYFGLTFISGDLGFPFYPSFFIQAAVEVPAYAFCIVLLSYVGRRNPTSIFMLIAGVSCGVALFIAPGVWKAIVVFIAKFAISVSFVILFVYTAEAYPTSIRGFGLSFLAIISMIGEIIAPLILIIANSWAPFPLVLCLVLSVTGGFLTLLLPETRGTTLPETIEEAESLGKTKQRIPTEEYQETKA